MPLWRPRLLGRHPARPQVAVGRGRKVAPEVRQRVDVRWRSIPDGQVVDGWVTSGVRTVHDCCVLLPFDEALSAVDSALRDGKVSRQQLLALHHVPPRLRTRGSRVDRIPGA